MITKEQKIALAVLNCIRGLGTSPQQFAVEPGRLQLNIQNSPQLIVYLESKNCSYNILLHDSLGDYIVFGPVHIQGEIIPKPNSDFDKSQVGSQFNFTTPTLPFKLNSQGGTINWQ